MKHPPLHFRPTSSAGFSLIEVTLAIGIISFALMAVIALLPVGLRSVQNATEQAGAAVVLESLSTALRHSATENPDQFEIFFASEKHSFSGPQTFTWEDLTLEGEKDADRKRLSAVVNVTELPKATTPGRAVVSIAWSAAANPQWDATNQRWTRAEGFMTSGLIFHPPTETMP